MATRNAVEIYDAAYARKQQMLAEPQKYQSSGPSRAPQPIPLSQDVQRKIADALAKEGAKLRQREEERRRRDPTYRPDAIELSNANLLEYDKYVDYYAVLEVDQFASAGEIKAAYKKQSLELHPDKQKGKSEAEKAAAKEKFLSMTAAHNILSDLATRRAYDNARDHIDARNESGLMDVGKFEKPAPTCVDVEVTIEQLYRGVRKQMRFERNEFKGTRWAKKTYDDYNVKVNRGEYEGATVWFRNEGDCGPFGRADLVFVVKQLPHAVFERLGDDLWYYDKTAVPAERLFYCGWAATLGPTPKSSRKHSEHSALNKVAALGSTLAQLLGFDRSGLGEAVVPGHGMPLRDGAPAEDADRTKGDLIVKFGVLPPADGVKFRRLVLAAGDGTLPMPPLGLLTPAAPSGTLPHDAARTLVTTAVLPAVLHKVHRGLADERRRRAAPPPSHPPPLPGDEPLPASVSPSAAPPCRALPPARALTGVCLLLGGGEHVTGSASHPAAAAPSAASAELMRLLSSALPALRWVVVHACAFVAEPLLGDELLAVEHAHVLLLEALPDEAPPPADAAHSSGGGALGESAAAPAAAPSEGARATAAAAATDASTAGPAPHDQWAGVSEWRVAYAPGVRVRERPGLASAAVGLVRAGQRLSGAVVPRRSAAADSVWVKLDAHSGGRLDGRFVQLITTDGARLLTPAHEYDAPSAAPAADASAGDAAADSAPSSTAAPARVSSERYLESAGAAREWDAADETAEVKLAVTQRDRDEREADAREEAEDGAWEADVAHRQDAARDEAYLEGGCADAHALLRHPSLACVQACRDGGGVLLCVGQACALLGHAGRRGYKGVGEPGETDEGGEARLTLAELEDIRADALADDIDIHYVKMRAWSAEMARAYFENNGVMPSRYVRGSGGGGGGTAGRDGRSARPRGATGLLLPYLVGAAPAPTGALDADGWRGLRAATLRAAVDECRHGYSALGLPPSTVLCVLPTHAHAARSVLGSAQPLKLALRGLRDAHERRHERLRKKKVDAQRLATLRAMEEELRAAYTHGAAAEHVDGILATWRENIAKAAKKGGSRTRVGEFRGVCTSCSACTGYTKPTDLPMGSRFWFQCACCGCGSMDHEKTEPRKEAYLSLS